MQDKKDSIICLMKAQHRRSKRKCLVKLAEKYCLTPSEYNELIRPLIKNHKRMIAHLEAEKQFEESYNKPKSAMEEIMNE